MCDSNEKKKVTDRKADTKTKTEMSEHFLWKHIFLLNKYKSCLFFLQRTYSNHPHFLINKNTHYNISDLCFNFNSVIFFNYLT